MPQIFISYRRADTKTISGRIYDRLEAAFGASNVFKDVQNIQPGSDFAKVLDDELQKCNVLLVLIGSSWIDIKDTNGNLRLHQENDVVRMEVEYGLKRSHSDSDFMLLPVLIGDVPDPTAKDLEKLPETMKGLFSRQVIHVRDDPDFRRDIDDLIEVLKRFDTQQSVVPQSSQHRILWVAAAIVVLLVVGTISLVARGVLSLSGSATPTVSAIDAANRLLTLTKEAEVAALATPTINYTQTIEVILTSFAIQTQAAIATRTPTATYTPQPTHTPTATQTPQPSDTALPTPTPTVNLTTTAYAVALSTANSLATINAQSTNDALATANAPTNTAEPTETLLPTSTPTFTPTSTLTPTLTATVTSIPPSATFTATNTLMPTAVPTQNGVNFAQALFDAQATQAALPFPIIHFSTLAPPENGFTRLTASNIETGYSLPGVCSDFSTDGTLLVVNGNGVYDVATGAKRFSISGYSSVFSSDGKLLAAAQDGVYDVATGVKRFSTTSVSIFSKDGTLLAVSNDGVYDVATGTKRFSIGYVQLSSAFSFSPDGTLLAVSNDGVYDVATGTKRFTIGDRDLAFSPNGKLLAVGNDGVYDVSTGVKRFAIGGVRPVFSPNNAMLAIEYDGVYDVATGTKRLSATGFSTAFSPDSSLVAISNSGIYEAATGSRRFPVAGFVIDFNPNGTLIALNGDAIYEVATGKRLVNIGGLDPTFSPDGTLMFLNTNSGCILYGSSQNHWPFHDGLIHIATQANVRPQPTNTIPRIGTVSNSDLIVVGRTPNSDWFQVIYNNSLGWIAASVVEVVKIPNDLPIITS